MTIPYENTEKDYFVEMMDIFLRVPDLFLAARKIIQTTTSQDRDAAIDDYVILAKEAQANCDTWLAKVQASTGFRVDLRHCPGILLLAFPRLTLRSGVGILLYHTVQLLLHMVAAHVWALEAPIPDRHRDFISRAADTQSMLPVAQVVTLAVSFCGSPQHGILGKSCITAPVMAVKAFYDTVKDPSQKQPFYQLAQRFYDDGYLRLAEYAGYTEKPPEEPLMPQQARRSSPSTYVNISCI